MFLIIEFIFLPIRGTELQRIKQRVDGSSFEPSEQYLNRVLETLKAKMGFEYEI